jgi:hypothetical protein
MKGVRRTKPPLGRGFGAGVCGSCPMLLCTILTFAMCADPNVAGEMAFGDLTVPIVWSRAEMRSCMDVGQQSAGSEPGLTHIESGWTVPEATMDEGSYSGRLVVHLDQARIEMQAYSWERMTPADRDALRRIYQATLWHEIGHVRTALRSIDAINAEGPISAPTAAGYTAAVRARGTVVAAKINFDQDEYDRVAEHGLRQDTLPPPLGGPDTIIRCPEH